MTNLPLSKTELRKQIRIAKILLSNNIQNAKDGFYVQNYHSGVLNEKENYAMYCKKKSCNGKLISNKTGKCISLWKNDGTGDSKKTTNSTCYYCDVCYLDQGFPKAEPTIKKSINENIMNDSSIGESRIIKDMKFVYFLLEKLNQIEEKNTNFHFDKTDVLEKEIDRFCNTITKQNETIYKVFDDEKILNFDQIENMLEISKMRNKELSRILREIFDYDNLIILVNELEFKETHERQNATNITNFKLVKVYAEPKELSKINSQKLDSSMKSNFQIDEVFQTNSEKMSNMRYNENLEKLRSNESKKPKSAIDRIVDKLLIERMEFEECL
jgi:hypothetical protein